MRLGIEVRKGIGPVKLFVGSVEVFVSLELTWLRIYP